jgi:hypothetical protein
LNFLSLQAVAVVDHAAQAQVKVAVVLEVFLDSAVNHFFLEQDIH